jgi:phage-related protein
MSSWTFGGTALTTYGRVTLLNDYLDVPERRGEDILLPYRHGKIFVPKYYDARKITVGIAMNAATAGALETLIDTLRAKIAPKTQQTLAETLEDTTVRNISATVDAPLQIQRFGPKVARAVIDFSCASAFWRAASATTSTTTINANPKAATVTNGGTAEETEPTIILTGPLQNTVLTNSTNGCVLTYTGTIASPRVVTISVSSGQWVATDDLGANKIANITHSGAASLFVLNVGSNTLSIADATHTTGTVGFSFYAPYL